MKDQEVILENLDRYPEDELATFTIEQCKNDSTQLVGRLYFNGIKGLDEGLKQVDTIIYKCKY